MTPDGRLSTLETTHRHTHDGVAAPTRLATMPRLDFYRDLEHIVAVRLREASILIGRSSSCDIQLPSESVSRQHARIIVGPAGDYLIEDLSTNGTRVNARVIENRTLLSPGDRIYIEEYVLVYQPDDVDPIRLEDAGSTVFMKRPHGLGEPSGSE